MVEVAGKGILVEAGGVERYVSPVEFDERRVAAAAVYCSDGRYGEQMDEFLHRALGYPRYDRVAMPGGAAALGSHFVTMREELALERQLRFLIAAHKLEHIVLIAHSECGYYHQVRLREKNLEAQQWVDLRRAAERIRAFTSERVMDVQGYLAKREGREVIFVRGAV